MNTFKTFLIEIQTGSEYQKFPRTKEISRNEFIEIIKTHCKKNFRDTIDQYNQKIWRGSNRYNFNYGIADSNSSSRLRIAANASSFILAFMSGSKLWEDYPPRNKSFVCSTDPSYADTYGLPCILIPFDGTKIGVCSKDDIFGSFKVSYEDMNAFISGIGNEYDLYNLSKAVASYESLAFYSEKMMEKCKEDPYRFAITVDSHTKAHLGTPNKNDPSIVEFKKTGDLIKLLETHFVPKENNFMVTTNIADLTREKEVWFEGKAVLMHPDKFFEEAAGLKI